MPPLKIAIVGAGNFGRALARLIEMYAPQHTVFLTDRQADSETIAGLNELAGQDVIIPAVPISKFEGVIRQLATVIDAQATVVDICTIKEYSVRIMRAHLPSSVQLIASHPLFGPESLAAAGWQLAGLNLVLWPERFPEERFAVLLKELSAMGLKVIRRSPEAHDRTLARSQFLSLFTGALLSKMNIESTDMNTRSFDELLDVRDTTRHDYQILLDVFKYNPYCDPVLASLLDTVTAVSADLRKHAARSDGETS